MTEAPELQITVRGDVPDAARSHLARRVRHVLEDAHAPVLAAHAVLTHEQDPARERRAHIEAGLDVDGVLVRAHVAGRDFKEAVALVEERLRRRLIQLQDRGRTRHRWLAVASDGEWRHGNLPRRPTAYYPRPADEREVVRRKAFALAPVSADEAAYEMDLLDHDFYLFTDRGTRRSAVIYRPAEPAAAGPPPRGETPAPPYLQAAPPPLLTESQARERLDSGGERFVFYRDRQDGQARVLYRRYDGHYGLISTW